MSHNCQRVQRHMSVYRELDPTARQAVDRAVGECEMCAAAWADEQIVLAHLAAMPDLAAPAGLRARLHAIPNSTPAPIPAPAPLVSDLSLRLLLMLLGATALWLYMLTAGPDGPPFGRLEPEVDPQAEARLVDSVDPDGALEITSRPEAIRRISPVDLGGFRAAPNRRDAADLVAAPAIGTAPDAATSRGAIPDPAPVAAAPEARGRTGTGPGAVPGGAAPAAGGDARDDVREGPHGTVAGEEPTPGEEGVRSCATVEVRPFFDLPSGSADCRECGDGVADDNELETARALADSLPALRIDVEYLTAAGTVAAGEPILIDAGSHTHRFAVPCERFENGDVILRATAVGHGDGALCPLGEAGHTMRIPDASGAAPIRFAIPIRPQCAAEPTPSATPIPTVTPTRPPAPSPTAVPSASPSPTLAATPGPRDPGPAMPTEDPSPMPTATYQPSPTPTSIWPQDGVRP